MSNDHDNAEEVKLILDDKTLFVKRQDGTILPIIIDGITHEEYSCVVSGKVKVQLPRNSSDRDRWPSYVGRDKDGRMVVKYGR